MLRFAPLGATPNPSSTPRPPTTPPATTPPVTTPPVTTPPSNPPGAGACTAVYRVVDEWQGGFQAEVTVRNNGTSTLNGWSVRWSLGSGQTVGQVWNGTLTSSGSAITVRNVSWNGSIAANGSAAFGFNGTWTGANSAPSGLTCTSP
ncbi:cellulose binding domain-containing protein [Plantactinospora sp. CA-290183]|uniref:cellulose binding domain-containing protein n=1 Tax=Plantactinospora sp. CA-290183 TaxID=3240006 RepID=UPI003D9103BC